MGVFNQNTEEYYESFYSGLSNISCRSNTYSARPGEKSICDVDRLNMGLYLLGDIITEATDKIEADERT